MIQVGIIGSGFIGPAHLEALRRVGDIEVVALCDGSLEMAQQKARQLNVAHAYGSVEALLAHPGLQVVHNCTPNHLHARINRQILSAGLHVFSEKPLCMTAEEARELVALAESAGVIHGVSFVYRQFAMVQQAAAMMRNGDVGRLFAVHGSYLQDWMLLETDYNWRVDSAQGGASRAMADIGSHWCDTVQFMTGRRIVEVMADLSIVWPTRGRPWPATRRSASIAMISRMKRGPSIPKIWGRSCFASTMAAKGALSFRRSAPGEKRPDGGDRRQPLFAGPGSGNATAAVDWPSPGAKPAAERRSEPDARRGRRQRPLPRRA